MSQYRDGATRGFSAGDSWALVLINAGVARDRGTKIAARPWDENGAVVLTDSPSEQAAPAAAGRATNIDQTLARHPASYTESPSIRSTYTNIISVPRRDSRIQPIVHVLLRYCPSAA